MEWLGKILEIVCCGVLAFVLQVLLHETGHLLAGLFAGCRFVSFQVFGWLIKKEKGHLRIVRYRLPSTLGQCLMAPGRRVDARAAQLLEWGGVLMNGITGIAALWNHSSLFMVVFGIMGIFMAATQGIPLRGLVANDGTCADVIRKRPQAADALWKQLEINALSSEGLRLNEMDPRLFAYSQEEADNVLGAALPLFAAQRFMEAFDFDSARIQLEKITGTKGLLPMHRYLAKVDLITCLLAQKEYERAEEEMEDPSFRQFLDQMKKFPNVWRLRALYARLAEGDVRAFEEAMHHFSETAACWPNSVEAQSERQMLEHILEM